MLPNQGEITYWSKTHTTLDKVEEIRTSETPYQVRKYVVKKVTRALIPHKEVTCYRESILITSNTVTCEILAISRSPDQTVLYKEYHNYIQFLY